MGHTWYLARERLCRRRRPNNNKHTKLLSVRAAARDGPSRATLSILLSLRSRRRRVMLRVMLVGALVSMVNGATLELHADNFDDTMEKHDEVLVHFHAPCAQPRQSRTRLPEQPHASSSAS